MSRVLFHFTTRSSVPGRNVPTIPKRILLEMMIGNPICVLYANEQFPSEFHRLCTAQSMGHSYSFPSLYGE